MKIAIAGGTGLIGQALTEHFIKKGHQVYILTRNSFENKERITYIQWLTPNGTPEKSLPKLDALINLAGDSIGSGRWTKAKKERILSSRLRATSSAIDLLRKLEQPPNVFLNASAIGYYGHSLHTIFTEENVDGGENNFLQDVVKQWEKECEMVPAHIRTVIPRLGLVLDKNAGALPKMMMPTRLFAGGPLGTGKQWYSWIHIDDVVKMFEFIIVNDHISGPINVTAPNPVRMNEMGKVIAQTLRRPYFLTTPTFALQLILGEMSSLLLEGQHVLPQKALDHGFQFSFPTITSAIPQLLKGK